jgi:hypothetical protein
MSNVIKTLKWKGEVTFEGTIDQFNAFKAAMEKLPVGISVSELGKIILRPRPGYITPAIISLIDAAKLDKLTEGATRMQFAKIKDIAGGIRTAHLHLGDDVVLLDKSQFKNILGEIARTTMEQRVDAEEDYYSMIKPIAE